uniref:CSON007947 protein n=1 Tax=Culicoides sonorensis TaxID=179676 RepID=A0A336JX63_CULSO
MECILCSQSYDDDDVVFPVKLSILGVQQNEENEDLYSVKITGMKCSNVDPKAFTLISCDLKAVRGHQGVLNVNFIYNNIKELTTTYQLFYRNKNGRLMNYLINVSFDYCKLDDNTFILETIGRKLLLRFWSKFDSAVMKGCPMNGVANYTNFEFDLQKQSLLPKIVPEGDFIFYVRNFETSTNKTLLELKVSAEVKSKTIMQLSMLNMDFR